MTATWTPTDQDKSHTASSGVLSSLVTLDQPLNQSLVTQSMVKAFPMHHFIDPQLWNTEDRWKATRVKGSPVYKALHGTDMELVDACEAGDVDGVLAALKNGANVNAHRDKYGASPLQ